MLRPGGEGEARRKRGLGRFKKREKSDIGWGCRRRHLSQRGFFKFILLRIKIEYHKKQWTRTEKIGAFNLGSMYVPMYDERLLNIEIGFKSFFHTICGAAIFLTLSGHLNPKGPDLISIVKFMNEGPCFEKRC